jgi:hypothetical protein
LYLRRKKFLAFPPHLGRNLLNQYSPSKLKDAYINRFLSLRTIDSLYSDPIILCRCRERELSIFDKCEKFS